MKRYKINITLLIVISIFFAAVVVIASENRGKETLTIDGGSKGAVTFPHKEHQDGLKDCNICHAKFPKESGVIKKLKDNKELEKKKVMNDVCIKCHKDYKTAGKSSGPANCNGCHG